MDALTSLLALGLGAVGYYYYVNKQLPILQEPTPDIPDNGTAPSVTGLPRLIKTITVGSGPIGLAADASGNVYIACNNGNNFSVLTPTGELYTFGNVVYPLSLALSLSNIYITNNQNDSSGGILTKIPLSNLNIAKLVRVGGTPTSVVVGAGRYYVANHSDNSISVMDDSTDAEITRISIPGLVRHLSISGSRLYSTSWDAGNRTGQVVSAINTGTNEILWSQLPQGEPYACYVHNGNILVTANSGDSTGPYGIFNVLSSTGQLVKSFKLGTRLAGITSNSKHVLVCDKYGLYVLDHSYNVLGRVDAGGKTLDWGICTYGDKVYVGHLYSNTVGILQY